MVYRVYVEKKPEYAHQAQVLCGELRDFVGVGGVSAVRIVQRYDVEGIDEELFKTAVRTVLSEPPVDEVRFSPPSGDFVLGVEYLPGQFDQRSDSAGECIQLLSQKERPVIASARIYVFDGDISESDKQKIEQYVINPVDSRRADLSKKTTLQTAWDKPAFPEVLFRFTELKEYAAGIYIDRYGMAMDEADFAYCVDYFKSEGKDPTLTELRVLDTYWSDHCRHTTFETIIDGVEFLDGENSCIEKTYGAYCTLRKKLGRENHPVTLMDIATIAARALCAEGKLSDWDRSDEVNACTVKIDVEVNGKNEPYLLLFKNETHNHPTEIEPFGGAATCIGGAIRDPLSGRAYVYQAMRVTGAGNPLCPAAETLPGKLPQRKITVQAAAGYSSYGNQIGLATGLVREIYHDDYRAKRMEIGAVLGAVPAANVRREKPAPGDLVLLLGGRTGRDGCGGATGSSKAHTGTSIETCGAEVQKGNAPTERQLQRLFQRKAAARLIKKCNDFGAGGIAVAVGELADGLEINLDAVPKKYEGLSGTELAISESQERMAVVVSEADAPEFIRYAGMENVEAAVIARVTEEPRLVMKWRGRAIVDISRTFLNSNGAEKHITIKCPAEVPLYTDSLNTPCCYAPQVMPHNGDDIAHNGAAHNVDAEMAHNGGDFASGTECPKFASGPLCRKLAGGPLRQRLIRLAADLNVCSQKGLIDRFDSTIGASTVLMPIGGERQLTPEDVMAALIPVGASEDWRFAETGTASGMAFGFDPFVAKASPYEGAYLAVLSSLAKLVAAGFPLKSVHLSFQEYFGRPGADGARWGAPFAALLGALQAQLDFGVAAIGGKDSMSGTFDSLDVPPTLVSFAVSHGPARHIRGSAFTGAGHAVLYIRPASESGGGASTVGASGEKRPLRPAAASCRTALSVVEALTQSDGGKPAALAVRAVERFGAAEALFKMCVGNGIGFTAEASVDAPLLFTSGFGAFIVELPDGQSVEDVVKMAAALPEAALCGAENAVSIVQLGVTAAEYVFSALGEKVPLDDVSEVWQETLEGIFPCRSTAAHPEVGGVTTPPYIASRNAPKFDIPSIRGLKARPRAVIPVFPGTNCETDTERALTAAGASADIVIVRNRTPEEAAASAVFLAKKLREAQMLVLPGGFSGGDEPDGSAKLITAFFRNAALQDAVYRLLGEQDGLILGICNGFQALVKLGLVPGGRIIEQSDGSPTLTFNTIGRHQSRLVTTRVVSTLSPWFLELCQGETHTIPISHGEGRFIADAPTVRALVESGQIATMYVDGGGQPSQDLAANPNGSVCAIEGITSPDGRVLGKMGHSERRGAWLYKNIPAANMFQKLFEGGVRYFS
ncbi:MAG: phosphoribosylformylglycinamidine synthase subunit PurQ [Spirochaetaceae bacterium]|jgi:phosphoribosylformylglycinamidine synthase|nr:phosphoribosylformylglycinamidine synthase subunit PurQ [Spirochaetaceae bacterium]